MLQLALENNGEQFDNDKQEVIKLLEYFKRLFKEPIRLPSPRAYDHQINLKEGTQPISVRQYRYSYYQKMEIKKIVRDLLQSGVIRQS